MIPAIRHLPKAYSRPQPADLLKAEQQATSRPEQRIRPERVIEAEWRSVNKPDPRPNAYQTDSTTFAIDESTLRETSHPALVTARYQQMSPQLHQKPGTHLKIEA